jgi:DNA-binding NarL/FixJ family response regulator
VASEPITVAIIDHQDVVHAGIEAWCATADPPILVVGNFHNPREFLASYPDVPSDEIDVVLLDPQIDGNRADFDAVRRLCDAGQWIELYHRQSHPAHR